MTLEQIQKLTDDEIRVRVAELQGWQVSWDEGWQGRHPRLHQPDDAPVILPNYPADLNACATFEATLTDDEHYDYRVTLAVVVSGKQGAWGLRGYNRQYVSATARQRCEAFLAVMGDKETQKP